MTFQAVIFDMDGLLVDSERIWYEVEDEMITDRGHVYTAEVRESVVGTRLDEFIPYLRNHYGFKESVEELIDELTNRLLVRIAEDVAAQPGAVEMIDYVRQSGIPHAIASSSPMSVINATLEAQGWGDLFPVRCTADDEPRGKPAPDVYLAAARRLAVDPTACLALEDSPNGSRAAVAAGMTCYAVPDLSHSSISDFADITPHVFASLHDVLAVLKNGR